MASARKTLAKLSIGELIEAIRRWNNADIRAHGEITPDLSMLLARRLVIKALERKLDEKENDNGSNR